ncbi:MAG: 4Fe-4S binding protein [Planctomycetes bacterium]|nr:4Fe-4S binding protein [Planctomycetota bacterium]NOG54972.1 NAD(P)-binding domain-containing protein [Planctomycetota bacterium]
MLRYLHSYVQWLHTRWPAGTVEKLPNVNEDGSTNVPGLYVAGDLTGVPLLKMASDSGARVVQALAQRHALPADHDDTLDLAVIGAGVAGLAAALEARTLGLRFAIYESAEPLATIANFPKGKPIFTYPEDMTPAGSLQFHEQSSIKEGLLDDLRQQALTGDQAITPVIAHVDHVAQSQSGTALEVHFGDKDMQPVRARTVLVAIGRSGNHRTLNVPGEDLPKVYNRLHDPKDYAGQRALVVGGGDSALETAIALAENGASVTLSYRKPEFSRAKPDNVERADRLIGDLQDAVPGRIRTLFRSSVAEIHDDDVVLNTDGAGHTESIPNDVVFTMIGREAPLDFFRRSGVRIRGEWSPWSIASLCLFFLFCVFMYHWKKTGVHIIDVPPLSWVTGIGDWWSGHGWFPYNLPDWWASLGGVFADPTTALGTLKISIGEPGFFYSIAYCLAVIIFGIDRMRRRRTQYVRVQTLTLMAVQCIPLFLLPYLLLPWLGNNGWFDSGAHSWLGWIGDQLFPVVNYGHGREYWRAFGLILAWPLFFWNVFTSEPLWGWLIISLIQTFVIIPLIVWRWGKGAYCGWICSCGALAETLGDRHRHKMPHGPKWNRLNLIGQVFLLFAFALFVLRVAGWMVGSDSWPSRGYGYLLHDIPVINYVWFVDLFWAGILGVGLYFHFSGRVWCRFACPLAALMHIYARFSRFRIFADKKKCISCNVCTSVCHQGIDIMNFANKGEPMIDPQCVRCSACVQSCPTSVLTFGHLTINGREIHDRLRAQ